jgi:hypothetical protein
MSSGLSNPLHHTNALDGAIRPVELAQHQTASFCSVSAGTVNHFVSLQILAGLVSHELADTCSY